jgi:hypothetical protein
LPSLPPRAVDTAVAARVVCAPHIQKIGNRAADATRRTWGFAVRLRVDGSGRLTIDSFRFTGFAEGVAMQADGKLVGGVATDLRFTCGVAARAAARRRFRFGISTVVHTGDRRHPACMSSFARRIRCLQLNRACERRNGVGPAEPNGRCASA